MIETGIHNFFTIYLVLCLGILVLLAIRERRRRSRLDEPRLEENMCVCPQCRNLFVMRHAKTSQCPRCGHLCRISKPRNIM